MIGVVVEAGRVGQRDCGRQVGLRPGEAPPHVRFRDIVTAKRNTVADTDQRQSGRLHGHIVQFDPVAGPSGGLHVTENAGTGQGGFHKMRPARAERRPPPSQRFASCLAGAVGHAARDRVGVDDLHPAGHAVRVNVDLPHPFDPATTRSVGMAGAAARPDQADFRPGRLMTLSPSLVRAIHVPSGRMP